MPLLTAKVAEALIEKGGSAKLSDRVAPRFKPGDRVLARNIHPKTHTRIPRYIRGKRGVVVSDYGVFIFPDSNALLVGKKPQHLYSVCFTHEELWGEKSGTDKLYIDMWDDYLEPAP